MDLNSLVNQKRRWKTFTILAIIAAVIIYGYFAPQCWFFDWGFGPDICKIYNGGFASGGTPYSGGMCGTCTGGGTCDCSGQSCETCIPPEGRIPCGLSGDATCGGYCPNLYSCFDFGMFFGGTGFCACVPDVVFEEGYEELDSCELYVSKYAGPVCDPSECADPDEVCVYYNEPEGEGCHCIVPPSGGAGQPSQ